MREQQEDEADRQAEAEEKRHRKEADAASSGAGGLPQSNDASAQECKLDSDGADLNLRQGLGCHHHIQGQSEAQLRGLQGRVTA